MGRTLTRCLLVLLGSVLVRGGLFAYGAPDFLPDGPHPRIWLTADRLNEMRAARDANNSDWVALDTWLASNYPATNYNLKCPSVANPTWRSVNWDGHAFASYRGLGWLTNIMNYALGYQMLKDVDAARANQYGSQAVAIVNGMITSHSVGDENDNGILFMRAGDGIYNLTNNEDEVAAAQAAGEYITPTYRMGKYGYTARSAFAVAVAYDWLYDLLTEEEKARWQDVLFRWFDWSRGATSEYNDGVVYNGVRYHEQSDGDCTGNNNCTTVAEGYQQGAAFDMPSDNFWSGFFIMMMLTGVATYGDNPDAAAYYDYAKTQMWENLLKFRWGSPLWEKGGDAVEGWNYGGGWFRNLYALLGLQTATGADVFSGVTFPEEALQSYIHATAPNLYDMYNHGQWSGASVGRPYQYHVFPLMRVLQVTGRNAWAAVAQDYLAKADFAADGNEWERLLFYKPNGASTSIASLPLVYENVGSGLFALRSSWNNAPDTVAAWFQMGKGTYSTHENYDEGAFQIIRGNDKLIWDSGLQRDEWRQSVIRFGVSGTTGSQLPWGVQWVVDEPVLAQEHNAAFDYMRADLRGGYQKFYYSSKRAALYLKDVVYLRPNLFVINDITRTDPSNANKWKDWQTQYPGTPVIDASRQLITFTNGASKAFVKTLFPSGVSFTAGNESGIYTYVKMRPDTVKEYDQFLHVIEAAASDAAQTTVEKIHSSEGNMIGAYIHDASSPTVVMFSFDKDGKDVSSTSTVTYAIDTIGEENTRHIVVHLSTGTQYTVQVATAVGSQTVTLIPSAHPESGTVYTTSSQGVLYFLSAPGIADTTVPTTTASPAGGTYAHAQDVTLAADEPATIYYTADGSTPTVASSVYSVPIHIAQTTTLKYFAKDTAGNSEPVKTAVYIISAEDTPPAIPATPVPTTNDNAAAWPVPFMGGKDAVISFGNIVPGSTLEIYTLDGQLVKSQEVSDTSCSFTPNDLASGTYCYVVKGANTSRTGKLVIIK